MKLAEALMARADLQKDLAWTKEQLARAARVQEGEQPHEDPAELIARAERRTEDLRALLVRINMANLAHPDAAGRTLTELLALRDPLAQRHAIYSAAYAEATVREERYGRSEIRWQNTFRPRELRGRIEALSVEFRKPHATIQQMN